MPRRSRLSPQPCLLPALAALALPPRRALIALATPPCLCLEALALPTRSLPGPTHLALAALALAHYCALTTPAPPPSRALPATSLPPFRAHCRRTPYLPVAPSLPRPCPPTHVVRGQRYHHRRMIPPYVVRGRQYHHRRTVTTTPAAPAAPSMEYGRGRHPSSIINRGRKPCRTVTATAAPAAPSLEYGRGRHPGLGRCLSPWPGTDASIPPRHRVPTKPRRTLRAQLSHPTALVSPSCLTTRPSRLSRPSVTPPH